MRKYSAGLITIGLISFFSAPARAQSAKTPGQIPVFVDAIGNEADSYIAQPGGNPNSPIRITDGNTYATPTMFVTNSGLGGGYGITIFSGGGGTYSESTGS